MISGFVVVDKPAGITSHDVVNRIRRIFGTRKVGHTGTLDPFATGVLPVAVNDGTKAIPFLDEGVKSYLAVMLLGITTDTLDTTGTILTDNGCVSISPERIAQVMETFSGTISQTPPMYSAIKSAGTPLYKLARQGQIVDRPARQVEIHSLEILDISLPRVMFQVVCSRGTYIRTLADDIGSELDCGAALESLRRLSSGPFELGQSHSLEELENAGRSTQLEECCVTLETALGHLPEIRLNESGAASVRHGKAPSWSQTVSGEAYGLSHGALLRLSKDCDGTLAAIAELKKHSDADSSIVLKRVFL